MLENSSNPNLRRAIAEHPTGTSTPPEGNDDTKVNKKKSKFPVPARIAAGAAAAALIGGGIFVATEGHGGQSPAKAPAENSAPATPKAEVSKAPVTPEITVASLELDPNATPEQWGQQYAQEMSNWNMAGASQKAYEDSLNFSGSTAEYSKGVAAKNAQLFATALYGPGWMDNSNFSYTTNFMLDRNQSSLVMYLATFKEKVPYQWKDVIESSNVLNTNGSQSTVEITTNSTNNSSENRASVLRPELPGLNNSKTVEDVTFTKTGDHVYVTDVQVKTN